MKGPLLQDFWNDFSNEEKATIQERAQQLRAEYLTLQELRKAHDLTQEHMAKLLNVRQESISKLENRSDMMLSTLKNYVQAMGGDLNLVVTFPNRPSVTLEDIGDLSDE